MLPCSTPHTPSHLILHLIVFLSFPVSLCLKEADTALFHTGKQSMLSIIDVKLH